MEVFDAARHDLAVVRLLFGQRVWICAGSRCSAGSDTARYQNSWMHERAWKGNESAGRTDAASNGSSNDPFLFFY